MPPKRYQTTRVALRWLLALLLIFPLTLGTFVPAEVPNSSPDKIGALQGHVAAALHHQFVRRDGLLSRMGFGSR